MPPAPKKDGFQDLFDDNEDLVEDNTQELPLDDLDDGAEEIDFENFEDDNAVKKVQQKQEEPKEKSPVKEEKTNRLDKRLAKLLKDKADLQAQLQETQEKLQQTSRFARKADKDSLINSAKALDESLAALKLAKKEALEKNDFDKVIELDDKMQDLKLKSTAFKAAAEDEDEEEDDQPPSRQQKQQQQDLPPALTDWIEENSWFVDGSDSKKKRQALAVNQDLLKEGYDPTSYEFYEEIDARLKELNKGKTAPTKQTASTNSVNRNSSSGPSSNEIAVKRGNTTYYRVTQEDRDAADLLGVDLKEYMVQKARTNTSTNKYTNIL